MKFTNIPQITYGNYRVNVSWTYLEKHLDEAVKETKLDLDPDFQRGHVWNEEQQIHYVEWIMRGGRSGRDILTNCVGWSGSSGLGEYVLVDGKQRINAVLRFLHNEIAVFGKNKFKDFDDNLRLISPDFVWHVNDLPSRKEVLQWYVDLNSGGVYHTKEEIEKVKKLIKAECL